jgi:hypothetical protein
MMNEPHPIDKAIYAHVRWKSHLSQAIETGKARASGPLTGSGATTFAISAAGWASGQLPSG